MNTLFDYQIKDVYVKPPRRGGGGAGKELPSDAMGIEIEMEIPEPPENGADANYGLKNFTVKADGSLRNWGIEFVSNPISFKERKVILDEFDNALTHKSLAKRIEDCARTSVHVHCNMEGKTYLQLMNILTAYAICEGPMVAWCGPTRMGNLFALRLPESATNFNRILENNSVYDSSHWNGDQRYSALNLCSLSTFNTIEFRSLRGVYDTTVYDKWMMALAKLIETASNEFSNPIEIVEYYQKTPNNVFLHRFLGDLIYDIEKLNKPCYNLMEEGYEYALSMATCHVDNWELDPKNDWRNDPVMQEWFKENQYTSLYSKATFRNHDYQRIKMGKIGNPPVMNRRNREDFDPEPNDWDEVEAENLDEGVNVDDEPAFRIRGNFGENGAVHIQGGIDWANAVAAPPLRAEPLNFQEIRFDPDMNIRFQQAVANIRRQRG